MRGTQLASDIKYYLDYSKWNEEKQQAETWPDSVKRVMDMHREHPKFQEAFQNPRFVELFNLTEKLYLEKTIIGSMRALQFGGAPIMKHNSKMFNCLGSNCDRPEFFQEAMYWLMSGCGVGYSVQIRHISKLPDIFNRTKGTKTFIIEDSIEGWADAFGVLMSSYFKTKGRFKEYYGYVIHFDYSSIRPKGAMISGGFKAPGPDGLKQSIERVEELINNLLKIGNRLKPINCYDIVCHMADAVLSGGVRRSATICLFSKEDDEMMSAKDFENFNMSTGINKQRARSNNSVVLLRQETTLEEFTKIFDKIKSWGEPGFYFVEDLDQATNPCFSPDTRIYTNNGLVKIEDLYKQGKSNILVTDDRILDKQGSINYLQKSTSLKEASPVQLTQQEADLYEIVTEHGYKVKSTEYHKYPTLRGKLELKDIKIGDKLLIQSNKGYFSDIGTYEEGIVLGMLIGDGCITNTEFRIQVWESDYENLEFLTNCIKQIIGEFQWSIKKNEHYGKVESYFISTVKFRDYFKNKGIDLTKLKKQIPEYIFQGSEELIKGFIQSFIVCDGSVCLTPNNNKGDVTILLSQSNKDILEQTQQLLSMFGIISRIYQVAEEQNKYLPDGKGGYKEYLCQSSYRITISRPNCINFEEKIGLFGRKSNLLKSFLDIRGRTCNKPEHYISRIKAINYVGKSDVYCLHQYDTNTVIANGIVSGNCVEIGFWPYTEEGRSGWEGCNLTSANGGKLNTRAKFLEACIGISFLGTLQAAYTDFKYVSAATKEIFDREALLGCSITGWMNNPEVLLDEQNMQDGAKLVLEINAEVAKIIGINPAARATCVKPEGNTSVFLETASGCHGEHDEMYLRLMQINKESEIAKYLNETNPTIIDESVWSSTKSDDVVYIPVIPKKGSIFKKDLIGIKQLEIVKKIQANWVEYGTRVEACVKPFLRHNVSNTVTVENWDEVKDFVFENKQYFSGVSFMGNFGDRDFKQAPFTSIYTPEQMLEKYGSAVMFASGLIVDGLYEFEDDLWDACAAVANRRNKLEGTKREVILKKDWIRRAKQFAKRYFKNDISQMAYCLKDLHLYHKWIEINRELKPIDFTKVNLKPNYTDADTMGSAGCVGNACEYNPEYLEKIK
jgi:intein/homing endonuclease